MLYPPRWVARTKAAYKMNMPIGQQIINKTHSDRPTIINKTHSDRPTNHQHDSLRYANKPLPHNSQWQKYYLLLQAYSQHLCNKRSHAVKLILKPEITVSCARCASDWEHYYVVTRMTALQDFITFRCHENFRSYILQKNINQLQVFTLLGYARHLQNLTLEDGTNMMSQNYQPIPQNIPEGWQPQLHLDKSLKSHICQLISGCGSEIHGATTLPWHQ